MDANELLRRYAEGRRDSRSQDLKGIDLIEANLSYIDFTGANLSRSDLSNSNLSHANLDWTILRGVRRFLENKLPACFDFAQLACALSKVEGQNFKGRIFSGNHLNLSRANLTRTNVRKTAQQTTPICQLHGDLIDLVLLMSGAALNSSAANNHMICV